MGMTKPDGMTRKDLEWTIEGKRGTKTGRLYGLHEMEIMGAKESLRQRARTGDTVTIKEI